MPAPLGPCPLPQKTQIPAVSTGFRLHWAWFASDAQLRRQGQSDPQEAEAWPSCCPQVWDELCTLRSGRGGDHWAPEQDQMVTATVDVQGPACVPCFFSSCLRVLYGVHRQVLGELAGVGSVYTISQAWTYMAACVDMPSFGLFQCTLTVPTSVLRHDVKGSPWMCATLFWFFYF